MGSQCDFERILILACWGVNRLLRIQNQFSEVAYDLLIENIEAFRIS